MVQFELNPSEFTQTIGTTSALVLPNVEGLERTRKAFVITNTSTGGQIISLGFQRDAVANTGIVLYPGGSAWEFEENDYKVFQRDIYAISSAASGTIAVQERVVTDR